MKIILKIIFISLISFYFTGCYEFVETKQVRVKIVDIDPPKHFYIIVNVDGKSEYIKISKRCDVKDDLIGKETIINKTTYKNNNEYHYSYSAYFDKYAYCNK